jgi:hypothetical protein
MASDELGSAEVVSVEVVCDDVVEGLGVEDHVTVEVMIDVVIEIVMVGAVGEVCKVCSACSEGASCVSPRLACGSTAAADCCASTWFAGSTV